MLKSKDSLSPGNDTNVIDALLPSSSITPVLVSISLKLSLSRAISPAAKNGVYITRVEVDHRIYHGVTNVGVKPTICGERRVGVETHILDFDEDIYERQVCVTFLEHIRDEIKFSSVDELKMQMQQDKKLAYHFFNQ